VGSVTPFFKLAYPRYVKWIDSTWIMDVWKFTNQVKVVIEVEKHWLPCLSRKHDAALMDLALTFNLTADQLKSINLCRSYLQVITVSNITTATGDRLLASGLIFLSLHPPIGTLGKFFCNSLVGALTLINRLVLGRIDRNMNGDGLLIVFIMFGSTI